MSIETSTSVFDRKRPLPEAFRHSELHAQIANFLAKDLFFIGAYPKSGTTWLQVMLNAHPEISCVGEGHFIDHFAPLLKTALDTHNKRISLNNKTVFDEFEPFPYFGKEHFHYLLVSAMALLLLRSVDLRRARVIGEKTADNFLHFPRLAALFPGAKFLHMVRNGRDCAVSAWFHNLQTTPAKLHRRHPSFEHFAEHFARNWKACVETALRFGAVHPDRCMIVRYEDLSLRPHDTMGLALRFLGTDATQEVVQHCVADGAFVKMSGGRPPGMEDRSSFLRQGTTGNWREHFTPGTDHMFLAVAGEAMARLGYR